jgi:arylformamidase
MRLPFDHGLTRDQIDADYTAKLCTSAEGFATTIAQYLTFSGPAQQLPGTQLNMRYDTASQARMDLYGSGENRPIFLFIHGGYWRALSKEQSAFMAPMLAGHGIATAVPDYTLAPTASITEITRQMRAAFAYLWHNAAALGIDRNRIVVGGSSAGGHLAAALAMPGWQAASNLPDPAVHATLPISGLFDLAPIAASHVQDWMQFTQSEIEALSPMRHAPGTARSHIVVAQTETPGFHRQSQAYAQALGAPLLTVPSRNHFDVVLDLMRPDTALSQTLLGLFVD